MKRNFRFLPLGVALLLLAALFVHNGWQNAAPAAAQEEVPATSTQERLIRVTGTGRVSVEPDLATVNLGVQTQAETAVEALEQNSEQMQAVIDALIEADVAEEDIQTQGLSLNPIYDQPAPVEEGQAERELQGYRASNVVEITVRNLDDLGTIIDEAIAAGGNTIQGIRFEVSDPQSAVTQARQAAFNEAQNKAQQLVELSEAELGPVIRIIESGGTPTPVFREEVAFDAAAAGVPVQAGTQEVEVFLEISWALE